MSNESLLSSVLFQLIIMIAAARSMHWVFRRFGQPGVIGEIVAGLLLGPSMFGHFFPEISSEIFAPSSGPTIFILSQIGLTLLMFQIGSDFEFSFLRKRRNRGTVSWIAVASISVPFVLGLLFGGVSHAALAADTDPVSYALFCGVAVAITAVPILGRILRQFGLTDSMVGVVAITAAAVNDVVGWVLLGCISSYVAAKISTLFVVTSVGSILMLGLVLWFILRPAVSRLLVILPVQEGYMSPNLLCIVLCLIFALGFLTFYIGIFTIFGGFAAGLLFFSHKSFTMAWRRQVSPLVLVLFLPIFFAATGLRTNVLGLSAADFGWLVLVLLISIGGKMVPVYLVSRASGLDHWQAAILGTLMNTRALMELIVLNVGYSLHVIPQNVFTMFVIMAVVTTVMTGPLLTFLLPQIGHRIAQQADA